MGKLYHLLWALKSVDCSAQKAVELRVVMTVVEKAASSVVVWVAWMVQLMVWSLVDERDSCLADGMVDAKVAMMASS